ncbi:MAG: NAD(P)/FAD-dependent oxidoreductase [Pyrinomonadaceae bacterium]
MREKDAIVIGGGAAGLFCAIEAGKRGRKVLVIEHNERVGKKIAISGGGRCNFTNINTSAENFISANPHFCKSALARYTPSDYISLVEKHRIAYHEKKLGQLFCDGSSQQIIQMLLEECRRANVEILCRCKVLSVRKDDAFRIETDHGSFVSASLVIATGGLSIPTLGATDFGYRIARQFGLQIEQARPALVPLTLTQETQRRLIELSGVSIDAAVSCLGKEFRENILITHRGLSGPAILQISSYWQPGAEVSINLMPGQNAQEIFAENHNPSVELATLLSQRLPRRFAQSWCNLYAPSRPLKQYTPAALQEISEKIHDWRIIPSGTEGFRKAEVTAGGVSTSELSSRTLEVKRVQGLYMIGEVVDVTGWLGGYNFQWAWASGFAAGQFA